MIIFAVAPSAVLYLAAAVRTPSDGNPVFVLVKMFMTCVSIHSQITKS